MNSFLLSVAKYRREADAKRMGWLGARLLFIIYIYIFNIIYKFVCEKFLLKNSAISLYLKVNKMLDEKGKMPCQNDEMPCQNDEMSCQNDETSYENDTNSRKYYYKSLIKTLLLNILCVLLSKEIIGVRPTPLRILNSEVIIYD